MCGVAGFVSTTPGPALAAFQANVLRTLAHRGPDDAGWLVGTPNDWHTGRGDPPPTPGTLALFHRRLSIIDVSASGHQPMTTPDQRYALIFNGEIYNYIELRDELTKEGYTFRSQSDTEVLLYAYIRWGAKVLPRLTGMFAFALLDFKQRTMVVARDPFGIKPLYYTKNHHGFAFASEIKALLPLVRRTVRAERVCDYLRDGLTDYGTQTMLEEVHQLPAASMLEVDLDTVHVRDAKRYWHINLNDQLDISFREAVQHTRELFLHNVRLHLRSDVPVGAALSGGVDSSAIVTAMRVLEPKADIRTFSFIADDPTINEERHADAAIQQAHAHAAKVHLAPEELVADLDRLIAMQDEPFGSTSIYAQYRVFRLAAEHGIKVMLDGQGADEMLAGYTGYYPARVGSLLGRGDVFGAYRFATRAARWPGIGSTKNLLMRGMRPLMPDWVQGVGRRLFKRPQFPNWLNATWFADRGVTYTDSQFARRHVLKQRLHGTLTKTSLPQLLRYEDRNSMTWSIESRVPFLTTELAEFLYALPEHFVLSPDGITKHVFREAMRGIVPDSILDRRDKIGFATPEQRWLGQLKPWLAAVLAPERLATIPVLNAAQVSTEWQETLADRRPFDWRIWRWVNFVRWAEQNEVLFA